MKVLFHSFVPFALAHGGQQIQIERTRSALQSLGVGVEYLRWYDGAQTADVLHFFGRIPTNLLLQARQKDLKIVVSDLLGAQSARSPTRLAAHKFTMRLMQRFLPRLITFPFDWDSYRLADASVAVTQREAQLFSELFGVPTGKVHVVPNGVEDIFFNHPAAKRGSWVVCVATITEVKRVVHLAEAAIRAKTPVWFIGKPYSESDAYAQQFRALANSQREIIRYDGAIPDREKLAQAYREARGFVLLSAWESLSLSALEASASECPLLLSDLPWARSVFGDKASYCPLSASPSQTAAVLRKFYDSAPQLPIPPRPPTWSSVAAQLKDLYTRL